MSVENLKNACRGSKEVLTLKEVCASVPLRWHERYGDGSDEKKRKIGLQLFKERETLTAERIAEIIGNESWTNLECECCGASGLRLVVRIYHIISIDFPYIDLCRGCCEVAAVIARHEEGVAEASQ